MKRVWLLAIIAVLLNACSIQPPKEGEPVGPAEVLLAQAQENVAQGEHDQAIALIERALRLEPRKAEAWLELARVRYETGDLGRAENFARRALQFAGGDQALARASRALLEKIRAAQGPG